MIRDTVLKGALGAALLAVVLTPAVEENVSVPPVGDGQASGASAIEFRWDAPDECPSEEAVHARLAEMLGNALDGGRDGATSSGRDRTTAIARVRYDAKAGPQAWSLRLWVISPGATRERSLEAESCELLADAAVLLAALVLDPSAAERAPTATADAALAARDVDLDDDAHEEPPTLPEESAEVEEATTDPVATSAASPDPKPKRRRPQISGAFRLASGVTLGVVPGISAPLEADGSVLLGRTRIDLGVQHTFESTVRLDDQARASFSMTSGIVRVGPAFRPVPRLVLRPALRAEVGVLIGRASGLDADLASGVTFAALGASGELSGALTRWLYLGVALEGHVALARPSFDVDQGVDGIREVYRLPAGGMRALAFLEVAFGGMVRASSGH